MRYEPNQFEEKWQKIWEDRGVYEAPQDTSKLKDKPKYYVLDMFPYPSGSGLHVGHPEGYTATDIVSRLKRMQGFNVLHPMGWDAFGLPAERAAMRDNIHPQIITKKNVDNFRRQIKRLGFSYDWKREVNTSEPDYYKWTQWIFTKLYEKGLAYLAEVPVNWCPALGTVLANEEVKDGKYVETGDLVERRLMKQWMLKITAYAQRLIDDLEDLDWPEGVKEMQRNWIGRSEGADIQFQVKGSAEVIDTFTTRADTLFGCTYVVLAPEHPLVAKLTIPDQKEAVDAYIQDVLNKSDFDRTEGNKEKIGVFTGSFAINPADGSEIPIWVADYVLASYGTGAVMAVPAHDDRDFEFSNKYDLPRIQVVKVDEHDFTESAYTGDGEHFNSAFLDGLNQREACKRMIQELESKNQGKGKVTYKLRDWLFSRQRYWGEPFPIAYDKNGDPQILGEGDLPVELPMVDAYKPTDDGKPPLARASKAWSDVMLSDGSKGSRETNTMPQWAGSCWYYLRFVSAYQDEKAWLEEDENYWMPVDLYIGGVEHAVLHLLYARFWHKVLYDCGLVHTKEPFQKLYNQGMILARSFQDDQGKYYFPEDTKEKDGVYFAKSTGRKLKTQVEKMSKSRYNVVSPDEVIEEYGADAMRLYEMFMGPLEQVKMWQMKGVEGVHRFLARTWRTLVDVESGEIASRIKGIPANSDPALEKLLHKTIQKVEQDTADLKFNTAISQMMTFMNEASSKDKLSKALMETFLQVLAPYAPHIAEELWSRLGHEGADDLIVAQRWPIFDPKLVVDDEITIVLQVMGKKRADIQVSKSATKDEIEALALADEHVKKFVGGKTIRRVIVVPGRLVNVVV